MSEPDKRDFNPNQTIQLTAEDVELIKFHAARPGARATEAPRSTPPPLPPEELISHQGDGGAAPAVPGAPSPAGARTGGGIDLPVLPVAGGSLQTGRARGVGKTVGYVALFVVLIGVAIAGGLMVGSRFGMTHADATGAATSAGPGTVPPSAAAMPSASPPAATPSVHTLTLPTIEIKGR